MARTKIVNMLLDDEEHCLFMEAMLEYESLNSNGRVSIGKFMRDIVLPLFKEGNVPSIYDEIRKHNIMYQEIVSTQPEDTDSAKSNNSIPDSEPKIVSSEPGHTDSNALKGWEEWSDEFSKEE